jgi:hypothetical protein
MFDSLILELISLGTIAIAGLIWTCILFLEGVSLSVGCPEPSKVVNWLVVSVGGVNSLLKFDSFGGNSMS